MNRIPAKVSLLTTLLLLSLAALPLAAADGETTAPEVTRTLPDRGTCGQDLTVTLKVEPPLGTESWLLVEHLPENVTVTHVDSVNNGAYNEAGHRIEWVSTSGRAATHTYNITPSKDLADSAVLEFHGEFRFHPAMDERSNTIGHIALTIDCFDSPTPPDQGVVRRSMAQEVRCGDTMQVALQVEPSSEVGAWSIEESPPTAFTVTDFSTLYNGHHDSATEVIKWLALRADATSLRYNVSVPEDLPDGTTYTFTGQSMFAPGMSEQNTIGGDDTTTVSCGSPPVLLWSLALVPLATVGGIFYVRRRSGSPPLSSDDP